jgi:putative ABC transport system permease protein
VNFATHLRHTVRRLARAPLFTGVTLLTLAIAIGANSAIFSVINSVLLKPLPYPEIGSLVGVWHTAPGLGIKMLNASPSTYFTYREENRSFESLGLWRDDTANVTGLAEPERVDSLSVTADLLPTLRVQPAVGRTFSARDDSPGSPETVILSYGYWQRKFGGDSGAIGKRLLVDGKARDIIGVMSKEFQFLDVKSDIILPLRLDRSKVFVGNFSYRSIARLRPGVTIAQANADVARMIPMMMDKFPAPPGFTRSMMEHTRVAPNIRPLADEVVGDVGKVLWVLMGTVGIVLLIACANVANLFLVRTEGRQQELAVRAALGASRGRIARGLLAESVGLALLGGALGLGLAYAGIRLLVALEPANLPRLHSIAIDAPVLLFTLGLSLLAGVLFGLIPVVRFGGYRLASALKEGGRANSDGRQRHRARAVLVVTQVALALVLLISAGLMIRTFQAMRNVRPGFTRPEEVLTLRVSIPNRDELGTERVARMHEQIMQRIARIPGVTSVGMSSSITMDGWDSNDPILVEQFPIPEGQMPPLRRYKWMAGPYFEAMGNPLIAGRTFTWTDVYNETPVVIVSENLAREYWKTPAAALGKRVRETPKSPWREIVGVVGNEHDNGVDKPAPTIVYWPIRLAHFWDREHFVQSELAYAVRSTRTGTPSLLSEIRQAVWSVNPTLPVAGVRTLDSIHRKSMARTSFTLVMLGIASAMALLLGLVGIYGVIAYSIAQRTREIGIRMALGAEHGAVRRLFVRNGLVLAGIGIATGLGAAFALTRTMTALLFNVNAADPLTYLTVAGGLAGAAALASYLPARRATSIDPVLALRSE